MNPFDSLKIQSDRKGVFQFALFLVVVFMLLTLFVHLLPNSFIDLEFSEEVQEDRNPALDFMMKAISWFGASWVAPLLIGITSLAFYLVAYRREAIFVASSFLSAAVAYVIKLAVNSAAPDRRPGPGHRTRSISEFPQWTHLVLRCLFWIPNFLDVSLINHSYSNSLGSSYFLATNDLHRSIFLGLPRGTLVNGCFRWFPARFALFDRYLTFVPEEEQKIRLITKSNYSSTLKNLTTYV
jgi:hypothetical protein